MTPLVAAVVLAAAVIHASWNAIAHGIRDQLVAFTLIGAADTVCGLAIAAAAPAPDAGAVLGTWLFKERFGGLRVAASALLAAGIAMMLLGG